MEMQDRALAMRRVGEAEEELGRARAASYALDAPADEAVEADNAWRSVVASVALARADRRGRHQPVGERVAVTWVDGE
jgi:hypothetical protein